MEDAIKEALKLTLKTHSIDGGFIEDGTKWCSAEEFGKILFDNLVYLLHEEDK